ncbi:putative transport protein YdbI [Chlorella vulgaris]
MATLCPAGLQQQMLASRQHAAVSRHSRLPATPQQRFCWPPAGSTQHCSHLAPQRSRAAPRRGVACSSNSPPIAYPTGGGGGDCTGSNFSSNPGGGKTLNDVILWTINLPWQKAFSWVVVAMVASQLSDFFGITMGTFIVSFVGNGFVQSGRDWLPLRRFSPQDRRRFLVVTYYTAIVSLFTLFGVLIIPDVVREGADLVSRLQTENLWVVVLEKMRKGLGEGAMDSLERFLLIASSDDVTRAIDFATLDTIAGGARTQYLGMALQNVLRQYTNAAATIVSELLSFTTKFAVGISLILSFMVVWDLPTIKRGVQSLRTSRIAPIYNTVAPSLEIFATLFGKALQAQARIAAVNTILTALGMWALKLPGAGLLSLFVFFCGFIPIAGVIISTVPIAFVALTEYGFTKLALVLLMITGVHFVEAYGLNPAIYSAHLKLHPLLVLTVLVVAEHSLGVWGLLLAVPLTVFALDYVVRYPQYTATGVAAAELENAVLGTTWDVHRHIKANEQPVTAQQQADFEAEAEGRRLSLKWTTLASLCPWQCDAQSNGMATSSSTPTQARWKLHGATYAAAAAPPHDNRRCWPPAAAARPVSRGATRRQIRAAYIERIKLLHPDVSVSGEDSTPAAAALNTAYDRLMAGFGTNSREDSDEEGEDPLDVFDVPEAEPNELFVNPFACYNVSPLQWRELQEAAKEAEAARRDPWSSLQQQGVQCSEGAFVYLSPRQLAIVCEELERAATAMDSTSLDAAAYFVSDCLGRARMANNRMPSRSGSWA